MIRAKCMCVLAVLSASAFAAEPSAEREGPRVNTAEAYEPQSTDPVRAAPSVEQPRAAASTGSQPQGADRLELDTTVVTGNRELPKVLYIVPWKKAGLGELPGQPFNTLLDEVLEPVDRDVFRREVTYFEVVARGADATQSTSAKQP